MKAPMTFQILAQLAELLDVKVVVVTKKFNLSDQDEKPIILPPESASSNWLFLEFIPPAEVDNAGHFNYIKNINCYFSVENFCVVCWKGYKEYHLCKMKCTRCNNGTSNCLNEIGVEINCDKCNFTFFNSNCFNFHKESICSRRMKCIKCSFEYATSFDYSKVTHACDSSQCKRCGEIFTFGNHNCFIKPLSIERLIKQDGRFKIIIAFDVESALIQSSHDAHEHRANLLVANIIFELEERKRAMRPLIFIFAHNFRGYDGRFILRELWNRRCKGVKFIFRGTKVIKITLGDIHFIDTNMLFNLPLAKLPQAFGFDESLIKGYFPYFFNDGTDENWRYEGELPAIHYFTPETMNEETSNAFYSWYEIEKKKYIPYTEKKYILVEQLIEYCKNDVLVLIEAVMRFRSTLKSITGIDPVTRNFTLASIAFEILRCKFLQKRTIGITPAEGYLQENCSIVANCYLDYIESLLGDRLQREKIITFDRSVIKVDGFHPLTNTVYEFNGCFFHGCMKCFPGLMQRQEDTKKRESKIEKRGFKVITIYECEFKQLIEQNHHVKSLYLNLKQKYLRLKFASRFTIRDALFGGRIENFQLSYKCNVNEKIRYLDFTSLPFCLKISKVSCWSS